MVLTEWVQPSGWTIALDDSDDAALETGMTRPCLAVNCGSSSRRFMYPITGAIDASRAKGIDEGSIEAWMRKGTAVDSTYGLFCYGKDIPSSGVSGFSGYIALINYGTGVTDTFKLLKYTTGTLSTLATFDFSPRFSTETNTKWQKLKMTWWQYTSSSIAFKIEFDDNSGQGLLSVNPDSSISYVDVAPLVSTKQMTVGIYETATDVARKIDDVKVSAAAGIPTDVIPTVTITSVTNHSGDPDIPAGGFKVIGTATDDLGFISSGDYADTAVEVKVDSGSWEALDDAGIVIGNLTSVTSTTDNTIVIAYQAIYTGISLGAHTVHVRSLDFGGNYSAEVTSAVTVT